MQDNGAGPYKRRMRDGQPFVSLSATRLVKRQGLVIDSRPGVQRITKEFRA